MSLANKYFKEVCEKCENHAKNMNCEDMLTCPAYKLYCMAKAKKKVVDNNKTTLEYKYTIIDGVKQDSTAKVIFKTEQSK